MRSNFAGGRRMGMAALAVVLLIAMISETKAGKVGLKQRVFRPVHQSSSDPGNNPLTAAAFLSGNDGAFNNAWENALIEVPESQAMEQEVITSSQRQAHASASSPHTRQQQQQQQQHPTDASFLQRDGLPASAYEPKTWLPDISPKPYVDVSVPHNKIEGGLGVASAAIPWEYRSYAGKLNTHKKAEPLIYTPLVIAKDESGTSAVDLTSLLNRKHTQFKRNSAHPEYAAALHADTEYSQSATDSTSHWMPQLPAGDAKKSWEKHFLDLYAPTPPPLFAPVAPQMRKTASQLKEAKRARSLMETAAKVAPLPSFLSRTERVQSLVTPLFDAQGSAVQYHDQSAADELRRQSHEVDIFAPAHAHRSVPTAARVAQRMDSDNAPAIFIELEDVLEQQENGLEAFDIDLPFPQAQQKDVFPW